MLVFAIVGPGEWMSIDVSPVNYYDSDSDCVFRKFRTIYINNEGNFAQKCNMCIDFSESL